MRNSLIFLAVFSILTVSNIGLAEDVGSEAPARSPMHMDVAKVNQLVDAFKNTSYVTETGKTCWEDIMKRLNECRTKILQNKTLVAYEMSAIQREIEQKNVGMFGKFKGANKAFESAEQSLMTQVMGPCQKQLFETSQTQNRRGKTKETTVSVCKRVCDPAKSPAEEAEEVRALNLQCNDSAHGLMKIVAGSLAEAKSYRAAIQSGAKKVMWGAGAGVAAIGLANELDQRSDKKKERRRIEAAEAEKNDAIIRNEANEPVDCKKTETYKTPECQAPLMAYCARSENNGKNGCQSFYTYYCSTEGAEKNFCFMRAARNRCVSQSGTPIKNGVLQESPACKWIAELPSECMNGEDNLICYPKFTFEFLTAECPKFPNDPVCQRHVAGNLVLQPVGPSEVITMEQYVPPPSDSSSSLVSLIDDAQPPAGSNLTILPVQPLPPTSNLLEGVSAGYNILCRADQLDCGQSAYVNPSRRTASDSPGQSQATK